jgi:anti-sigma regulatory factor (Ser/Thr protein kinase)
MTAGRVQEFAHTAVIVESDDTLRTRLVPELRRSLAAREHVLMVVGAHTAGLVQAELGPLGGLLEWGDPDSFYQRLGRAYERFRRYLADEYAAGRRVHVVAEPDLSTGPGREPPVYRAAAYLCYESVCNDTFAPYGSAVTCVWDSRHYPGGIIEGVRRVHRHELTAAGRVVSPHYVDPDRYLAGGGHVAVAEPPRTVDRELDLTDTTELARLRAVLSGWTRQQDFDTAAADDVALAVTEIAANGLAHGAAPVRVRAWHHADTLVVQVDDSAGRPLPPAAGYRRPGADQGAGGRGMWLARQLADSVTVHTGPGHTSVRLHFPYPVIHRGTRP